MNTAVYLHKNAGSLDEQVFEVALQRRQRLGQLRVPNHQPHDAVPGSQPGALVAQRSLRGARVYRMLI